MHTPQLNSGALLAGRGQLRNALPYFEKAAQLGLPEGVQGVAQIKELLLELEMDPAQQAFAAFQQASDAEAMQQAAMRFPLLVQEEFMAMIEQVIAEQVPLEHRPTFTQRLTWLRQIANTQKRSTQ